MLVFLVRHAHAVKGEPDEERALSERGREEAHALAERLAGHSTPPTLVVTSPLKRAKETADAVAEKTGARIRIDGGLAPGATAADLRRAIAGEEGPVAVVGHQPDCSEIAIELTGGDPGFPTGGVSEIRLGD